MSTRDDQHDRGLLQGVAEGDRRALERLYLAYQPRLMRFLHRISSQREEEAVNDTFFTVWQKAGDFPGASRVSTWLIGIAWRHALEALRRNGDVAERRSGAIGESEPQSDASLVDDARDQWIAQGLAALPLEQRATLELAYGIGHSCQEIADIMECPVDTVLAWMFQARLNLQNSLSKRERIENNAPLTGNSADRPPCTAEC